MEYLLDLELVSLVEIQEYWDWCLCLGPNPREEIQLIGAVLWVISNASHEEGSEFGVVSK
jgi:hypothetical protein